MFSQLESLLQRVHLLMPFRSIYSTEFAVLLPFRLVKGNLAIIHPRVPRVAMILYSLVLSFFIRRTRQVCMFSLTASLPEMSSYIYERKERAAAFVCKRSVAGVVVNVYSIDIKRFHCYNSLRAHGGRLYFIAFWRLLIFLW